MRSIAIVSIVVSVLTATASAEDWQAAINRDHLLVGRIVRTTDGAALTEVDLVAVLARSAYVLLGEKHDNPDHHRLQARMIAGLVTAGHRPTLVLEMLTPEQIAPLEKHRGKRPFDIAGIAGALRWGETGWPQWNIYEPIFASAVAHDLRLAAGSPPIAEVRAVARLGTSAIDRAWVRTLLLAHPLVEADEARLVETIAAAHCGHLPATSLPGMLTAQRARDAALATALLSSSSGSAVLIAGTGHTRRDFGLPLLIAHAAPTRPSVSLAFVEVQINREKPSDYAAVFSAATLPFDYVWFTPAVDDTDPCTKFRRTLERLRSTD